MVVNSGSEAVMVYKHTKLGQSELVATDKIQNTSTPESRKSPKLTDKNDARYGLELVKNSVDTGCSRQAKAKFSELINELFDVFSKNEWDSNAIWQAKKYKLNRVSDQFFLPNQRTPIHYKDYPQQQIDPFLEKKMITPCNSPYKLPTILIRKKNGKDRPAVDYSQMNRQTTKSCWPSLP